MSDDKAGRRLELRPPGSERRKPPAVLSDIDWDRFKAEISTSPLRRRFAAARRKLISGTGGCVRVCVCSRVCARTSDPCCLLLAERTMEQASNSMRTDPGCLLAPRGLGVGGSTACPPAVLGRHGPEIPFCCFISFREGPVRSGPVAAAPPRRHGTCFSGRAMLREGPPLSLLLS